MKKLIASILMVLTVASSAQLTYVTTLDEEYDYIVPPMKVEIYGNFIDNDKFLIAYGPNIGEIAYAYYDILNPDFSLYKRITIDTSGWGALGYIYSSVFFSDHLYNSDDKIEVTYNISKYADYGTYTGYEAIGVVIINEDGVELQRLDSVSLDGNEFFQLNGKTYSEVKNKEGKRDIYEADGTLPCKTCSSYEATTNKKAPEKVYDINLFPNPTTNQITLSVNTDKTGMKVHIYSTDGRLFKSASVANGNNLIDTADLVAGTYIYNVLTDDELIHASQFIKN